MRVSAVLNLWLLSAIFAFSSNVAIAGPKPNIIWIMADDLGYGDLGCYGQKIIQTPRIDQMCAEGMKFTDFYAGATVCAPSRCVLMTGKHNGHATVRGNSRSKAQSLTDEDVTVAEALHQAGYYNLLIGKWGLGDHAFDSQIGLPNNQGFDYFFGYANQHHAHNPYPRFLWKNNEHFPLGNIVHVTDEGTWGEAGWATKRVKHSQTAFIEETLHFLNQPQDKPFFLYLSLTVPHANNEATKPTGNGQHVDSYGIYADKDWPEPDKGQAAMVTLMDEGVGQILDLLKTRGLADNTLVFFTSDNGHHKEGGNNPDFFDANGPLRGMKRDLTEGGIRVPMIAWWPGTIAAGSQTEHISYFGDFFATACDLAGLSTPSDLDSISFLPTLLGQTDTQKTHDYLFWEFYERKSSQAIRQGDWKAIRTPMISGQVELYNLKDDLGEQTNLADKHPEIVQNLSGLMDQAHVENPNWSTKTQQPGP